MVVPGFWRSQLDPERVMNVQVTHWHKDEHEQREEYLTVEEPFEIHIAGRSLAVTMRTPGHDFDLATGLLLTESVIARPRDVLAIEGATDADGLPLANVVNVTLRKSEQPEALVPRQATFERHFTVSASCGLCGKNSIDDLMLALPPLELGDVRFSAAGIYDLPAKLRAGQSVFSHTG